MNIGWDSKMPAHKKAFCKNGHARTPENLNASSGCKQCALVYARAWDKADRKKYPAEYKILNRKMDQRARENNSEGYKRSHENCRLKRIYGITLEQYQEKLLAQNNQCAICHNVLSPGRKSSNTPMLDHDHETGITRDFLCRRCNMALGLLGDSILVLESALNYLKRHK